MSYRLSACLIILRIATLPAVGNEPEKSTLDLAGRWDFAMTSTPLDLESFDPSHLTYSATAKLPGTMDENGLGVSNTFRKRTNSLSREKTFEGVAFYRRQVTIPPHWQSQRVTLQLERTRKTRVWLDGRCVGSCLRVTTPHLYDLGTTLESGPHTLLIAVDNRSAHWPPAKSHMFSDDTQTNWNGVVGRLELSMTPRVWISHLRVVTDRARHRAQLQFHLENTTGSAANPRLALHVTRMGAGEAKVILEQSQILACPPSGSDAEMVAELGTDAASWDEFSAAYYRGELTLELGGVAQKVEKNFGLVDFRPVGQQFQVNDKTIFLRGKHDACVFPLTGYAPMTRPEWIKVFQTAQSYGINHYRFHTWCPPEAAFAAADELGVYLQPELPCWGALQAAETQVTLDDPNAVAFGVEKKKVTRVYDPSKPTAAELFFIEEGKALLDAYGDHPSFRMMTLGNELGGNGQVMARMVDELRRYDQARRLFAQGSNNHFNYAFPGVRDDFFTTIRTSRKTWNKLDNTVRASFAFVDQDQGGSINRDRPSTQRNFRSALAQVSLPVIAHETGQYQYYPDYRELSLYTGVLKPWNLLEARALLERQGMLDQSHEFFRAAGIFASILYGEDMESNLRTDGLAGFQLLDLQDFPGQGTALVGPLNAFMLSKGLITPEQWRQCCDRVVLLGEFPDYCLEAGENFNAQIRLANFGPATIQRPVLEWKLASLAGATLASGRVDAPLADQGHITSLGRISVPLPAVTEAQKLLLTLHLAASPYTKEYPLWVYPTSAVAAPQILVRESLDEETLGLLAQGRRVLLTPPPAAVENWSLDGLFNTEFWSHAMFSRIAKSQNMRPSAGTMGLLIQNTHPALAKFPSEFHSNWQWWSISRYSRPLILDDAPAGYRPIVQSIDNLWRSHKLGILCEFKVGPGRLMVASSDLAAIKAYPEGRAYQGSILAYMASDRFAPEVELDPNSPLALRLRGKMSGLESRH